MRPAEQVALLIAAAFANSVVLDPPAAASARPALRLLALHGVLSALVASAAAAADWLAWHGLLAPLNLDLYAPLATVLVTGATAMLAGYGLPRWRPALARADWWLVAGNAVVVSVVLGAALKQSTFANYLAGAFAAGATLALALLLLGGLERRLQQNAVPTAFAGLPLRLLNAGMLALAGTGLAGLGQAL